MLNLIKHQWPDIVKIYLYVKDLFESKYQLLIKNKKSKSIPWLFSIIYDGYENLEDFNSTKTRRVLIVYDSMVADVGSNLNLSPDVTELFLRLKNPQYFICFDITILFRSAKNFKT